MPQPNTKTKYRPLPAALLTLVVLLASTLLIWLAVVRPQLGKGRTETLCDNFDRSELLADGDTAAQVLPTTRRSTPSGWSSTCPAPSRRVSWKWSCPTPTPARNWPAPPA